MATHLVEIASLPQALSYDEAVEIVYRDDLDWIEEKLRQGLSVLVECDKQLNLYLYKALRERLRRKSNAQKWSCRLISGHAQAAEDGSPPMGMQQTRMQRILQELHGAIFANETGQIIVLPHLDVLTTTTRSGLNLEAREAATMLYENPEAIFLGFKDPHFEIPQVIENVFAVRCSLIGIPRARLANIILQREARKFGTQTFNPYSLYKYLSGLNAVRARQILEHFANRVDYDPANSGSVEAIYREIRQMTLLSDLELPRVDLENDIGGYSKVKQQLKTEILDLLVLKEQATDAAVIQRIEEIVPKGILLYGPPGTGKTFFAKAIATALDATILIVSGPELKSKWVGESEANLRQVFSQARKSAPSIIVFDELDSFASTRGTYQGSGVEHSMVNQLLTEMDGFRKEEMVFIVGTTNFLEAIDPALTRPGRFEFSIEIPYPTPDDRKHILQIYQKKFNLPFDDANLDLLVQKTGGYVDDRQSARFSGDHLYAVMRALKREELRRAKGPMAVTQDDIDRVLGERRKKPVKLQSQEERTIAVHEAGHATCAYLLPHCSNIEQITIATGEEDILGYVMRAVRQNKYVVTQAELTDDICVLLGGRMAEQLVLGDISIGSADDLQRATEICRVMVEQWGMSADIGLRTFSNPHVPMAHSPDVPMRHPISDAQAARIDQAIERLLETQRQRAEQLISSHRAQLDTLVERLLQKKTVNLADIESIFSPNPPSSPPVSPTPESK